MKKLLPLLAFLWIGCEKSFEPLPDRNPEAIFEELWSTFDREYAPFEERGVDWRQQYEKFRPKVSSTTTDQELADVLRALLSTLDDGHVTLTVPNSEIFNSNKVFREKQDDDLFSLNLVKTYLQSNAVRGEDDAYLYGKLKGENISYIYFEHVGENFNVMPSFLESDADGFIVDLRHNQGGDFTYSFPAISHFSAQRRLVFKSKTIDGINSFTPWKEWYLEPGAKPILKPLVVLVDRYTISAAERTVMAFKTLPQVTILGDTTSGAHGTMVGRELSNGWFYSLVPQKVLMPDGLSYEGKGIAPHLAIKNTKVGMAGGKDEVLEQAIAVLTGN
jgi:carboxyl-terminal processing protease